MHRSKRHGTRALRDSGIKLLIMLVLLNGQECRSHYLWYKHTWEQRVFGPINNDCYNWCNNWFSEHSWGSSTFISSRDLRWNVVRRLELQSFQLLGHHNIYTNFYLHEIFANHVPKFNKWLQIPIRCINNCDYILQYFGYINWSSLPCHDYETANLSYTRRSKHDRLSGYFYRSFRYFLVRGIRRINIG